MKPLNVFIALLIGLCAFAQAPQALNYQAVARDNAGVVLASTNLDVRFTIKQSSATGVNVFQETHATTTDAMGGFTLEIGQGTAGTGSFTAINWAAGPYFLEVEMDVNSSGSYTSMGTSEMLSVPYAQYANRAGIADSLAGFNANTLANPKSCVTIYDSTFYTFLVDSLYDQNGNGLKEAYVAYVETPDSNFFCRQMIATRSFAVRKNGVLQNIGAASGYIGPCVPNKVLGFSTNENLFQVGPGDYLEFFHSIITENGIETYTFVKQL